MPKYSPLLLSLLALSCSLVAAPKETSCGTMASPYRATARHIEGKGIGYKRGYTSVDLFIAPPSTLQHRFIPFFDARLHIFDNGKIATNAGLGLRYISSSFVYGINSYYDYRETSHQKYNQYSLGLEALGKVWDFRLNGYLPVGNKKSEFYNTRFGYFQGNSMYLNTTREFAMKGLNAEAGIHIKDLSFMKVYGAFGPYYFEKQGQNAIGGKVRASLTFLDHIKIEASTSYDPIFHWIGQGELSFMIPFGPKKKLSKKPTCRRPYLNDRAVQPVDRQEIIVVDHKNYSPIAIDPTTDTPWNFVFVNNLSHSLGTYESPYPTLLEAEDNSLPGDIIYVFPGDHQDTGMAQGITLQPNQKLFGSGIDIPLATTMGEILIPKQSSSFPLITNSSGAIVTLDDNNEVAGLNLSTENSLDYGIVGGNPASFTALIHTPYIHNNIVNVPNTTHAKIGLVTESATVLKNQIATTDGSVGIYIISSENLSNTTISGNTLTSGDGLTGNGIFLGTTVGDISNVIVSDNSIALGNGANIEGIFLQSAGEISKILIQSNTVTIEHSDGGLGIYLQSIGNLSNSDISYNATTVKSGTHTTGINVYSSLGSITNATLSHNTASTTESGTGINLYSLSGSIANTTFFHNTVSAGDNNGTGIYLFAPAGITDTILSYNTTSTGNITGRGIYLWSGAGGGGSITGAVLSNNTVSTGADGIGIYLESSNNISNVAISYNSATTGGDTGIGLTSSGNISDITMSHNSATTGNGDGGIGIDLSSSSGNISDITMSYNSATTGNGDGEIGINLRSSSGNISDITLSHNSATTGNGVGGVGINLRSSSGDLSNVTMSYNSAATGNGDAGGGIDLISFSGNLSDIAMSYNSATVGAGNNANGILLASSSGNISDVSLLHNSVVMESGTNVTGIVFYPFSSNCSDILLSNNSAIMKSETNPGIAFYPNSNTDSSCVTLIDNTSNSPILLFKSGTADLILNTPASHGNAPEPTGNFTTGTCGE